MSSSSDAAPSHRPAEVPHLLLLIAQPADADAAARTLRQALPRATFHHAATVAAARDTLRATDFDTIVADHTLPDGTSLDVLALLRETSVQTPLLVLIPAEQAGTAEQVVAAGAVDYLGCHADASHLPALPAKVREALSAHHLRLRVKRLIYQKEQRKLLDTLRSTVATVKHEINNPLAIISGNAQLLLELARASDLGDDFVLPVQDIEEASQRIAASLEKLGNLREIITRQYIDEDHSLIDLDGP